MSWRLSYIWKKQLFTDINFIFVTWQNKQRSKHTKDQIRISEHVCMSTSWENHYWLSRLTPQVPEQRVQLETSEVGRGGKRGARPIGCRVGKRGQDDGARAYGKEADEDGAQDKHDDEEDDERGLGVDVGPYQAHQQAQQGDGRGIKKRPPVARRQDLVGGSCQSPI